MLKKNHVSGACMLGEAPLYTKALHSHRKNEESIMFLIPQARPRPT